MSDQPYPPDEGRTHYDGCYIERGHHNCAITEIESLRAQLAEYRAAITALDCWMEKHDPKARSDYWRWRHRYHAIVTDARGDHE